MCLDVKTENSFVRSSSWRLFRLEGELIKDKAFSCPLTGPNATCYLEDQGQQTVEIENDIFEVTVSGFVSLVRFPL